MWVGTAVVVSDGIHRLRIGRTRLGIFRGHNAQACAEPRRLGGDFTPLVKVVVACHLDGMFLGAPWRHPRRCASFYGSLLPLSRAQGPLSPCTCLISMRTSLPSSFSLVGMPCANIETARPVTPVFSRFFFFFPTINRGGAQQAPGEAVQQHAQAERPDRAPPEQDATGVPHASRGEGQGLGWQVRGEDHGEARGYHRR